MKAFLPALAALTLVALPAAARPYNVDYAQSTVSFSGAHADQPFSGKFGKWTAAIDFDPANLAASSIKASFDLASASTGNSMYDGTLPQADWFNAAAQPQATFSSTAIAANADGTYTVAGDLTIRGITKPASFSFTLSDLAQSPVKATAQIPIERLDFDLGRKSDPTAEWVSKTIQVTLDIVATPAQ